MKIKTIEHLLTKWDFILITTIQNKYYCTCISDETEAQFPSSFYWLVVELDSMAGCQVSEPMPFPLYSMVNRNVEN